MATTSIISPREGDRYITWSRCWTISSSPKYSLSLCEVYASSMLNRCMFQVTIKCGTQKIKTQCKIDSTLQQKWKDTQVRFEHLNIWTNIFWKGVREIGPPLQLGHVVQIVEGSRNALQYFKCISAERTNLSIARGVDWTQWFFKFRVASDFVTSGFDISVQLTRWN